MGKHEGCCLSLTVGSRAAVALFHRHVAAEIIRAEVTDQVLSIHVIHVSNLSNLQPNENGLIRVRFEGGHEEEIGPQIARPLMDADRHFRAAALNRSPNKKRSFLPPGKDKEPATVSTAAAIASHLAA